MLTSIMLQIFFPNVHITDDLSLSPETPNISLLLLGHNLYNDNNLDIL